jgi:hypothetical protein
MIISQKIEAIRAVCVRVNPRKKWSVEPYRTGDTECFGYNLPDYDSTAKVYGMSAYHNSELRKVMLHLCGKEVS